MKRDRNRDKSIEQLLRRSAVADAGAQASDSCLDAETLAAWIDGGLDEQAVAMAEAHASACARCQALMGALARSAPAPAARWPWRREWHLRWLVPLTAAAAAALLWMVVPTNRSVPEELETQRQMAEDRVAAVPGQRPPAPPPAVAPQSKAADQLAVKGESATARRAETRQLEKRDAPADANIARERSTPSTPAAAPSVAAAPEAAFGTLSQSIALGVVEIVSPDPAFRWRLGAAGFVQHSADGGKTWEVLPTGVSTQLTAGSATSPSICWLVGQAGTVLRTTDGRSWQRVPFPEAADLAGVQAVDERTAAATTADGRTFRTTDAGSTWARVLPQDF